MCGCFFVFTYSACTNNCLQVSNAHAFLNSLEQSKKSQSLRYKNKRQRTFLPFLQCFLTVMLVVHLAIMRFSCSICQEEQFMYLSRDNVSKCFLRLSFHH